jgi:hypothetical protein
MIPVLIASALLHRWRVRGQMQMRERRNWDDETKVMPTFPQNERTNYQELALGMVKAMILDDGFLKEGQFEVYIVWFCKTLQNWKALVCTTLKDGQYFEVTHNGDLRETYIDTYVKTENRKILDSELLG